MSEEWFHIRRWRENRVSLVGGEMKTPQAEKLFEKLNSENNSETPLALLVRVDDESIAKIAKSQEEATQEWKIVRFNSKFLLEGLDKDE